MARMQARPTVMGLAFVNATAKAIGRKPLKAAIHDPKIPWVARRVATNQGNLGMKYEPTVTANLMNAEERENLWQLRKALRITPMY